MKKTAIFGLPRFESRPCRSGRGHAGPEDARRIASAATAAHKPPPEPDEVGGAGDPEGEKRRLRRAQHRRHSGSGGQRPGRLPERDPGRGADPGGPAAAERVADR